MLTKSEWRVLKTLRETTKQLSIREIATNTKVSYPLLVGKGGIVNRFLNVKWVKVNENKEKKVQITEAGKRYFEESKNHYAFLYQQ